MAQAISDRRSHKLNYNMRNSVLRKLATSATLIELCVLEPEVSKILQISTLDIMAFKVANELKRWNNVKICMLTASDVGANTALLKEIVINVITKSNVVESILEIIYEVGRVAELNI